MGGATIAVQPGRLMVACISTVYMASSAANAAMTAPAELLAEAGVILPGTTIILWHEDGAAAMGVAQTSDDLQAAQERSHVDMQGTSVVNSSGGTDVKGAVLKSLEDSAWPSRSVNREYWGCMQKFTPSIADLGF